MKQFWFYLWQEKKRYLCLGVICILALTGICALAHRQNQESIAAALASDYQTQPQTAKERSTLANAMALQQLELVDWGQNGIIQTSDLSQTPTRLEGLILAIRLAGQEKAAFLAEEQTSCFTNVPAWAQPYAAFGLAQGLLPPTEDPMAPLTTEQYCQDLIYALQQQGIHVEAEYFANALTETMDYGCLADLTYQALQTKQTSGQADNTTISLASQLLQAGIIQEKAAVLADLPVAANTMTNYQNYFMAYLKDTTGYFPDTEKNKQLMRQWMEDVNSPFILVNKEHPLPADYVPDLTKGDLPTKSQNTAMQPQALAALTDLFTEAQAEGITLFTRSGYRSYQTQKGLYGNGANPYRAAPGTSEHQTGLAMDAVNAKNALSSSLADSQEARWLQDNAYRFGFIIRYPKGKEDITGYPAEWWHLRYVGKTIRCV